MKVVIVGASFAGVSAAVAVRKQHPEAEILIIEKQNDIGFLSGGLHLYLQGIVKNLQEAVFIKKEQLAAAHIHLLLESIVVDVDTQQQLLTYYFRNDKNFLTYDKLILATGSGQWSHKIEGSDSPRMIKYKYLADAQAAIQQLQQSQSIAIIGGGQIGAEALASLLSLKKEIHLFESMDYLLAKYFDQEMVENVQKDLSQAGVIFHFGETVAAIQDLETGVLISTQSQQVQTDCGLFALNIRPKLDFLDSAIQQRTDQTIVVDQFLQTTAKNVFAIGDCIDLENSLAEQRYLPLVNNAVRAGLVVASNLKEPILPFVGSLRTIATKVFNYYLASTGITEAEGFFYPGEIAVTELEQLGLPFTSKELIKGKLIYDKRTHQLLGAQLVSKLNCLEKINTLALSIQTKQTLESLMQNDYFYQPAFSNVLDITNHLGASALWSEHHEN
jgi:NADPH-dependent 2,4-dienoyl-CoA reductase/sulfur reductase-like enzyme